MNNDKYNYSANHQELSRLLPWYVNKTLHGAELQAVEDHLSVCLTCKRELIALQKLANAMVQESPMDSVEHAAFSRLRSRIRTSQGQDLPVAVEKYPVQGQTLHVAGNITPIKAAPIQKSKYFTLRPALALAASLLIALFIPRFLDTGLSPSADFRTLSSPNHALQPSHVNEIRVVFADQLSQQHKDNILASIKGQVIGTPTPQGVYTVRLEQVTDAKRVLEVVDLLRKDSSVVFAEPSYALLSLVQTEETK